jgi:hypothetical protein
VWPALYLAHLDQSWLQLCHIVWDLSLLFDYRGQCWVFLASSLVYLGPTWACLWAPDRSQTMLCWGVKCKFGVLEHPGFILGPYEAIMSRLWVSSGHLGHILGIFWAILGLSWAHLGAILGHLGVVFDYIEAVLGHIGPSRGHREVVLGQLGPS